MTKPFGSDPDASIVNFDDAFYKRKANTCAFDGYIQFLKQPEYVFQLFIGYTLSIIL